MIRTKDNKLSKQVFVSVVIVALMTVTAFALVFAMNEQSALAATNENIVAINTGTTGTPCVEWFNRDQDPEIPFLISNADQLAGLAQITNNIISSQRFDFHSRTIRLTADIDLSAYGKGANFNSGRGWVPIGSLWPFRGTFDGAGYTISNLYINDPIRHMTVVRFGLFGFLGQGARIKNLIVKGEVTSAGNVTGGIVGEMQTAWFGVEDSRFYGTITALEPFSGNNPAGGIVGRATDGWVNNSNFDGEIIGYDSSGGIAGEAFDGTVIEGSGAQGTISSRRGAAGGIVGLLHDSNTDRVEFTGSISAYSGAGGIAGRVLAECSITNASADASVKAQADAGGIAGFMDRSILSLSEFSGIVTATQGHAGGIVGRAINNSWVQGVAASGTVASPNIAAAKQWQGIAGFMSGDAYRLNTHNYENLELFLFEPSPHEYSITFNNLLGGTHDNPVTATADDFPLALNPASREGYAFDGWFIDNQGEAVEQITEAGDVTLYARWTAIVIVPNGLEWWHIFLIVLGSVGVAVAIGVAVVVIIKKRKSAVSNAPTTSAIENIPTDQEDITVSASGNNHNNGNGYSNDNGNYAFPEDLTKREIEVARLILRGNSQREIMEELVITEHTVKKHISSILEKSDCSNQKEFIIKYKI